MEDETREIMAQQDGSGVEESEFSLEAENRYLTFMLAGNVYGIDIVRVKEIIEYSSVTKVPMTPDYLSGVINLRGNVVPVVNLASRIDKPVSDQTKKTCILIVEVKCDDSSMETGIIVDSVNEVAGLDSDNLEQAPSFGVDLRSDFVMYMGRDDKGFIIILDIDRVLDVRELEDFDPLQLAKSSSTTGRTLADSLRAGD